MPSVAAAEAMAVAAAAAAVAEWEAAAAAGSTIAEWEAVTGSVAVEAVTGSTAADLGLKVLAAGAASMVAAAVEEWATFGAAGPMAAKLAVAARAAVAGPAAREWESALRKTLVVRKPAFRLPTACPMCLPVLLYLRMADVPFDLEVDTSNPNSEHIPYVEFGNCVAFNNEKGGVIQYLRDSSILDLNSTLPTDYSSSSVEPTRIMASTWLADALQYELWVVSDGSIANDIYFSDVPWPIRKILHWKRLRDEKHDLYSRLKRSTADLGQEIYRRADVVYDVLSETLMKDEVYLFGNSPKDVDALVLGHALFVLNVLPETSVLRSTLQKHTRLVKYAEHHMFVLLGIPSGSFSRTLPYVAYDVCVMSGQVHYEQYIDLKEYKLKHHMLVPSDILLELDEDGCNPLPGETEDPKRFTIASGRCKKCIRTMLKGLVINEALQICFEDFTEDNIVLTESGKVKFKNVTVISCLRRGPEFMRRLHRNFKCAGKIIRDLFKFITPTGIQYKIPEDIMHLLNLIEREFESRSMFPVHASLVPLTQCSFFFQKMYETIRCVLPFEEFRAILDKLPYVDGWKKKVMNNALLNYPIKRKPESYEVPPNKVDQQNLNKYQKGCLNDLGFDPPRNQKVLSIEEQEMIKELRLIDYWRNRTVHRMEPHRECAKVGNNAPSNAPYKAEGSELVNYVRFPMAPTYLQWELIKRREADGHVVWESFF